MGEGEGEGQGEGEEGCEGRGARVREVGRARSRLWARRICDGGLKKTILHLWGLWGVSSYAYGAVSKEASTGRYEGISQWQQQKALQTKKRPSSIPTSHLLPTISGPIRQRSPSPESLRCQVDHARTPLKSQALPFPCQHISIGPNFRWEQSEIHPRRWTTANTTSPRARQERPPPGDR